MNSNRTFFAIGSFAVLGLSFVSGAPTKHDGKVKRPIPTFAKDVAPIIYSKCAPCHHQGEVAPFNLTSYEEAKAKAPTLVAAVKTKYMPPWQAVSHGEFVNERTLTPSQIETIEAWSKAGAPKGDMSKAPQAPVYTPGWAMGKPDFVGKPSRAYEVAAEGEDEYRCFVIPTNFPEDRYVTAVENKPGNRHVVHHILVYLDKSGTARKKDGKDGKLGYTSFGGPGFVPVGSLGGWAPGLTYQKLPNENGLILPKGADIVIQVHYHKDGKPETDLSQIGLQFAKGPIDKMVRWESVDNELISIEPGEKNHEVKANVTLPAPITVLDVIPHMHLIGHDMTVTATLPDGTKKQLIQVEPYDFNWQTRYTYKEPLHLPAGTKLDLVAHYDNSSDNPHNPNNPPKKVVFGEQTTNEMCFAFFSYTIDSEHITKGIYGKSGERMIAEQEHSMLDRIFDNFDVNHDGFLDVDEMTKAIVYFQAAEPSNGKTPEDPAKSAKLAIAFYGKEQKGKLSRSEFNKLAKSHGG